MQAAYLVLTIDKRHAMIKPLKPIYNILYCYEGSTKTILIWRKFKNGYLC